MSLKILTINNAYKGGGAEEIARLLHNNLNKEKNISSIFAYGRKGKNKDKKSFNFSFKPEIIFHSLISRAFGLQGYGSYFSTKRLERYIKKNNFDLIHLHNLHGYYINLSFIKFLKKINIPVVWTFHDFWPITGNCVYPFECKRWQAGCGHCPKKNRLPKTWLDFSSYIWKKKKKLFQKNWQPTIVTPSKWISKMVKKSFLKNKEIKVIPNGVNTDLFKPRNKKKIRQELGLPQDKNIILFLSADLENKRKGIKYILKTLPLIDSKDVLILTVGKKLNLKNVSNKKNIIQLGYLLEREKIAKAYNGADLFAITSLQDNLPNTVNESLASGTPIVGFKTGGIKEQVTKDCGILVEKKDVKSLSREINNLLKDDLKRNNFSKNCRKRAIEKYLVKDFKNNYLSLYRKLIS